MKRVGFVVIALSVSMSLSALGFSSTARAASNKEQITGIEHKIMDATSSDEAMKYIDQKDIDVYDIHSPLQYKGGSAVHGDLDDFFNNATDIKGNFVELNVVTDSKLAVAYSIQHFTWKTKDGKPMQGTFRVTDVYHKVDGQWKVFHTHASVPIDPKTGQAQMNLAS
jgi:ketosteroid isomerase-like protein